MSGFAQVIGGTPGDRCGCDQCAAIVHAIRALPPARFGMAQSQSPAAALYPYQPLINGGGYLTTRTDNLIHEARRWLPPGADRSWKRGVWA